jgi:protein-S-isoprenylcysteine O-methyltransferase Ste14
MKATAFEFRFRILIAAAFYVLGFWAPWIRYGDAAPATTAWLALSATLANWGWLPLDQSTILVTSLAIFFACAGALLRIWGSAWLGVSVVQSPAMHAGQVVAAGPYRFSRNPLYLGTWLFSLGVAILMPPSGAVVFLVANILFYLRLIFAEEEYLAAQQGTAYLEYRQQVPRIVPTLSSRRNLSHSLRRMSGRSGLALQPEYPDPLPFALFRSFSAGEGLPASPSACG